MALGSKLLLSTYLLLIFITLAQSAVAVQKWSFRFNPGCSMCIEGYSYNSSITFTNTGDEALKPKQLIVKDANELVFFSSPVNVTIMPAEQTTFRFMLVMPPPTRGSTLFYKPCLILQKGIMCANTFSRLFIKPLNSLECLSDDDCYENEVCFNNKCKPLECSGYAKGHRCKPSFLGYGVLSLLALLLLFAIAIWHNTKKKGFF